MLCNNDILINEKEGQEHGVRVHMLVCMYVGILKKKEKKVFSQVPVTGKQGKQGWYQSFPHGVYYLKGITVWLKVIHSSHIFLLCFSQLVKLFPPTVYFNNVFLCPEMSPISVVCLSVRLQLKDYFLKEVFSPLTKPKSLKIDTFSTIISSVLSLF